MQAWVGLHEWVGLHAWMGAIQQAVAIPAFSLMHMLTLLASYIFVA